MDKIAPTHYSKVALLCLLLIVPAVISTLNTSQAAYEAAGQTAAGDTYMPLLSRDADPTLPLPVFGVQMYGSTTPDSLYYPDMMRTHTTWVRLPIAWATVEPANVEPADFNWGPVDKALSASQVDKGGRTFIVTIDGNPEWAATYESGPINKVGLNEFVEFVVALVERYDGDGKKDAPGRPVVNYWEMYNEPDAGSRASGMRKWGEDGAAYAAMLAAVYPRIKAANPQAQVLFGGIAYDWFEEDGGAFVRRFLDDALNAGAGNYFDIFNFHAYPAFADDWALYGPGLLQKTQFLANKLKNEYGLQKPMVISEAGWHSNFVDGVPGSPDIQAYYVTQLFTQSMAAGLKTMIWWTMVDAGGYYPYDNGLVTNSDPPVKKKSYRAFQTAVAELSSAHFERKLSDAETGHSRLEAYQFRDKVHRRTLFVTWFNPEDWRVPLDPSAGQLLRLPAGSATVKDGINGNPTVIYDGNDGAVDGLITLTVTRAPLYVEVSW